MLTRPGSAQSPSLLSRLTCFLYGVVSLESRAKYVLQCGVTLIARSRRSLRTSMALVMLILRPAWSPASLLAKLRNSARSASWLCLSPGPRDMESSPSCQHSAVTWERWWPLATYHSHVIHRPPAQALVSFQAPLDQVWRKGVQAVPPVQHNIIIITTDPSSSSSSSTWTGPPWRLRGWEEPAEPSPSAPAWAPSSTKTGLGDHWEHIYRPSEGRLFTERMLSKI